MYGILKTTLYNLIYSSNLDYMDFDRFDSILEYVPDIKLKIQEQNIMDEDIMKTISEFCKRLDNKKVLVSLSGGVDSMVLITNTLTDAAHKLDKIFTLHVIKSVLSFPYRSQDSLILQYAQMMGSCRLFYIEKFMYFCDIQLVVITQIAQDRQAHRV